MNQAHRFLFDEEAATAVEYSVMLALILLACIGAITLAGGETYNFWGNNQSAIEAAINGP
jgi:Flp pilus assembly pilin Flp